MNYGYSAVLGARFVHCAIMIKRNLLNVLPMGIGGNVRIVWFYIAKCIAHESTYNPSFKTCIFNIGKHI